MNRGLALRTKCDHHAHSIGVLATEMGYHARCLNCKAIGPGCPSIKAARQALLLLGARAGSKYR